MLLMNFCELDKYLPVQTVIIFVPIFYTKGPLINMFNIFAGIVRFMWSFGECIWYCKCPIQCNHCGRYTVTRLPTIIHISIFHHHFFRRHGYLNLVLLMFWDWRKFFWHVTLLDDHIASRVFGENRIFSKNRVTCNWCSTFRSGLVVKCQKSTSTNSNFRPMNSASI